jgi:hypothetical protein
MKMMFRTAILAATLTFPALLAACGSSTTPAVTQTELEAQLIEAQVDQELAVKPALFVGKTSDPNVYVAIVNRNGKIEVYICDGTPTKISVATWFEGTLKDGVLAGTAENGSSPSGTLTGETISGTFKLPNNSSLAFTASRSDQLPANSWQAFSGVKNPTFLSTGEPIVFRKGWIVLPDGTQRGGASKQPNPGITENINSTTGPTNDNDVVGTGTNPDPVTQEVILGSCKELKTMFDATMN